MRIRKDDATDVFIVCPDKPPEFVAEEAPEVIEAELAEEDHEIQDDATGDVTSFVTTNAPIKWVFSSGIVLRWSISDPSGNIVAEGEQDAV